MRVPRECLVEYGRQQPCGHSIHVRLYVTPLQSAVASQVVACQHGKLQPTSWPDSERQVMRKGENEKKKRSQGDIRWHLHGLRSRATRGQMEGCRLGQVTLPAVRTSSRPSRPSSWTVQPYQPKEEEARNTPSVRGPRCILRGNAEGATAARTLSSLLPLNPIAVDRSPAEKHTCARRMPRCLEGGGRF